MPGLKFYFSLLGDDSLQRLEVWCPTIHQSVKVLRSLIFLRLQEYHFNQLPESSEKLRLFFNGQELEDQYTIGNYGIVENNVIQVIIMNILYETNETKSEKVKFLNLENFEEEELDPLQSKSNIESLKNDKYYCVGDHVDAFYPPTGGWFPAHIVDIKRDQSSEDEIYYYVAFNKPSLGTYVARRLSSIRPESYKIIRRQELEPGKMVMALNNDGQWYAGAIERIKRSDQDRSIRLWLNLVTQGQEMPFVRQMIRFRLGYILSLEYNVEMAQRSEELDQIIKFGSKIDRKIEPDCLVCKDNSIETECKECGCQICHRKDEPAKQLVCDECNRSTHFWCLQSPVTSVPTQRDWYCDRCRNETVEEIRQKQKNHLEHKSNPKVSNWGFGMACVARSLSKEIPKSNVFGPIPTVPVGTWWRFRVQVAEAGVHAPLVAGIHGRENDGAYSVVYSANNPDDVDLGEEIYYTANGGGSRTRKNSFHKNVLGGQLKREVLALARNCPVEVNEKTGGHAADQWRSGKPVRLLRNGNSRISNDIRSTYLPKIGVRYDGLYKVVKYWPQAGSNGHSVWKFLLRRDDPEPAPWTEAGRYKARKLGLVLQYPPGWCQEVAQKRSWKIDKKILTIQKRNLEKKQAINAKLVGNGKQKPQQQLADDKINKKIQEYFQIPDHLRQLTLLDELNTKMWTFLLETKMTKEEFVHNVYQSFKCVCCMEVVRDPITTNCGHNFCSECIQQTLDNLQNQCPVCRQQSFLTSQLKLIKSNNSTKTIKILKSNTILEKILLEIKSL